MTTSLSSWAMNTEQVDDVSLRAVSLQCWWLLLVVLVVIMIMIVVYSDSLGPCKKLIKVNKSVCSH